MCTFMLHIVTNFTKYVIQTFFCLRSGYQTIFLQLCGWVGGPHPTKWYNLQDCKISSRVEIPKLDPSVAITSEIFLIWTNVANTNVS